RRLPGLVHQYGRYEWMDPGSAEMRAMAIRVILDVVDRYDVDGVHIDDTFYPYPISRGGRDVPFPDDATYHAYRTRGGTLSHDDWRRHSVDLFVEQLYRAVKQAKPWVKVGISPFGIWRPGNPPSVQGFDAYARLFADSRKWLANGWVDYLAPQLYWPIGQAGQSYADLLSWWVQQNDKGRNLWVGTYAARVAGTQGSGPPWPAKEIVDQIRLTREEPGATGDIFFSMGALMSDPDSLDERLLAGPYASPALVPSSPWLGTTKPIRPSVSLSLAAGGARVVEFAPGDGRSPHQWVVQVRVDSVWHTAIVSGTARAYPLGGGLETADAVSVIAVDRVGNTSAPTVVVRPVDADR
ncbi:MAG: glycoside hydrolase family 10 protein, partial [Gemmatimonadaceae bacterium]